MNTFEKSFMALCNDLREDAIKVLDDSLTYIVCRLSVNQNVGVSWHYGERDNERFAFFLREYLSYMDERLGEKEWCDAWGDMFMSLSGSFKSMRGQFFTPAGLADLTSLLSCVEASGGRRMINDCACGSARMLLGAWTICRGHGEDVYLVGEDIDGICCKMAAVNMAVHGCIGEVIRHDSLREPEEFRYGYVINETLFCLGLPSIRVSHDKKDFFKLNGNERIREVDWPLADAVNIQER